ncbi:MAG TPA: hypothetical protein PKH79_08195, partial [Prolixibacteraceae bacterium]|nr:hypothetical protein [Prolixibacteraceae bacterium]
WLFIFKIPKTPSMIRDNYPLDYRDHREGTFAFVHIFVFVHLYVFQYSILSSLVVAGILFCRVQGGIGIG